MTADDLQRLLNDRHVGPLAATYRDDLTALVAADAARPPPLQPVVFYGSSSIRLWHTLADDFPGLPVVNRGFGGSTLAQAVQLFDALVTPLAPRAVVLYSGDNDLAEAGASPEQVGRSLHDFVVTLRTRLGDIPLAVLAIKPSPARWHLRGAVTAANAACRAVLAGHTNTAFVDVFGPMLDTHGQLRGELFDADGLHLSREGYRLWRRQLWPDGTPYGPAEFAPSGSSAVKREYHKWHSPSLDREMELLVFGHAGARVLVFPTRANRFFEYENAGLVAALAPKIQAGWLQLFCVDSVDHESLYCFWKHPADRIARHGQYERYILDEVIPLTQKLNPNMCLISHGCSLGAYHALNIGLRHPQRFGRVVAFSGRYDLTAATECFRDLFDGYRSNEVYFHTPNAFMPGVHDPGQLAALRHLRVTLTVGEHDPFLEDNRRMAQVLAAKGIPHEMFVWGGRAHRYSDWRHMAALYL